LTAPQEFETRTQYEVVTDGETVSELDVPPETGDPVLPDEPTYH
jgi:hypothetical protein